MYISPGVVREKSKREGGKRKEEASEANDDNAGSGRSRRKEEKGGGERRKSGRLQIVYRSRAQVLRPFIPRRSGASQYWTAFIPRRSANPSVLGHRISSAAGAVLFAFRSRTLHPRDFRLVATLSLTSTSNLRRPQPRNNRGRHPWRSYQRAVPRDI